jgi:dynein heavy chain
MEDILRDLLYRNVGEFVQVVEQFCPNSVDIVDKETVHISGGRFPMFTVDLKYINASKDGPAKFTYSATPDMLMAALLTHFEVPFKNLKGMIKVEKRVMRKLFWAYEPVIGIPHIGEDWASNLRDRMVRVVQYALQHMETYLTTLTEFSDLINLDVSEYAAQAEAKYFANDAIQMPDLCELAKKHAFDSEHILNSFPSGISLGFIMVDCKTVRSMMASKHKAIATKLFQLMEYKMREYAEAVLFRSSV